MKKIYVILYILLLSILMATSVFALNIKANKGIVRWIDEYDKYDISKSNINVQLKNNAGFVSLNVFTKDKNKLRLLMKLSYTSYLEEDDAIIITAIGKGYLIKDKSIISLDELIEIHAYNNKLDMFGNTFALQDVKVRKIR